MERIEHAGTVVEVHEDTAVIEIWDAASCKEGGACGCCSYMSGGARRVDVERDGLEVGETVEVSVPASSGYMSAFVLFVLPLLLFIGGMFLGAQFQTQATGNDLTTLAGGFGGFALGILVAVLYNKHLAAEGAKPEVRRVGSRQS